MGVAQGVVFVVLAGLSATACALALLRVGVIRLESPLGIHRDGLPAGSSAPRIDAVAADGTEVKVPNGDRYQFLLFTDLSLAEYPEVAAAVSELAASQEAAVALVTQRDATLSVAVLEALELELPVVQTSPDGYWDFNVRVMPFATVLAPDGTVLAVGVVSTPERVASVWARARHSEHARQSAAEAIA
jgi:hypothetical protein